VLTSSVKGLTGSAHRTAYSVSKGGLDALTRVVATGYGKAGVHCNAVVFLASDTAVFITGQVICVDGGLVDHTAALSPAGSRGGA
jgi:NAD(P)-dependent dehydrogenase (short-subunit alcohol dehydrogenase family)